MLTISLKEKKVCCFGAVDKRQNDQVRLVASRLLRFNDNILLMDMFSLFVDNGKVFSIERNVVRKQYGCSCRCMLSCGLVVDKKITELSLHQHTISSFLKSYSTISNPLMVQ